MICDSSGTLQLRTFAHRLSHHRLCIHPHSWSTSCPALIQCHGTRHLVPRSSTMLGRGRSIGRQLPLVFKDTARSAPLRSHFGIWPHSRQRMIASQVRQEQVRALSLMPVLTLMTPDGYLAPPSCPRHNPRLDFRARQSPFRHPLCICAGIRTRATQRPTAVRLTRSRVFSGS